MHILNLTIPNLLGYAVVSCMFVMAIAHASGVLELKRLLRKRQRRFDRFLPRLRQRPESAIAGLASQSGLHPSGVALHRLLEEPALARDDLAVCSWLESAIGQAVGPLRTRIDRTRAAAPVVGITGTIGGFLLATFNFSQNPDQGQLMMSVSLALVTTLVAGIVAMIERWILQSVLDPLEFELLMHGQETLAKGRSMLAEIDRRRGAEAERRLVMRPGDVGWESLVPGGSPSPAGFASHGWVQ